MKFSRQKNLENFYIKEYLALNFNWWITQIENFNKKSKNFFEIF